MTARDSVVYCSFCSKSQHEVAKIIAGVGAYICDECVMLCVDIVNEVVAGEAEYASWFDETGHVRMGKPR